MRITYDPAKRLRTLVERGLDFEDAGVVFRGATVEIEDTRKDYGEVRMICYGHLAARMIVVGGLCVARHQSTCLQHEESK